MAQPAIILDGTMAYGTEVLTINGVAYKANKITITPQWAEAESLGITGSPDRKRWTKGRYKFTAELQLATGSTAYPPAGTTFTHAVENETSDITFVVLDTPHEADNSPSSVRVLNLTAEQAIGSITTA